MPVAARMADLAFPWAGLAVDTWLMACLLSTHQWLGSCLSSWLIQWVWNEGIRVMITHFLSQGWSPCHVSINSLFRDAWHPHIASIWVINSLRDLLPRMRKWLFHFLVLHSHQWKHILPSSGCSIWVTWWESSKPAYRDNFLQLVASQLGLSFQLCW
jgi:hypothetical protein